VARSPRRSFLLAAFAFGASVAVTLLVFPTAREGGRAVLATGILVSALLAALVWSLASTRERALRAAREMTDRLRQREKELETAAAKASAGAVEARMALRRQAVLYEAAMGLSQALSAEDALPRLLQTLVSAIGWDFGACWTVDRGRQVLRPVSVFTSGDGLGAFAAATRSRAFGRGVGLPGRVWESGAPVWVPDLGGIEILERAEVARAERVGSAFACPIAVGGDVLGVLEFAVRRREELDGRFIEMFETIGSQTAQFLERDAAEQARRTSEAQTQAVVENMLEGLIVIDGRGLILSVNPAAEQIFGYAAWELLGQHVKLLVPLSVPSPEAFLRDAFAKAIGRLTEWEGRRKNGEVFRFELSFFELWTPGGRQFAGNVRDISERRKLAQMKKDFVATVSHELRTPLTSIRGSLSLLAGGALGELPDEALEVVRIAERNTLRLIGLINDILDLERMEAGRLEIAPRPTAASAVIERSLEAVRALADQAGVELEAPAAAGVLLADEDRIVQVLVNLLSNAVKFSPRGSAVTVSAAPAGGGMVEIAVADRGRGIPSSHLGLLFQRFQQVETSDARKKGGTGLGLAISKAIVEQHGGTIAVASRLGEGSTFRVRLPAPAARDDSFLGQLEGMAGGGPPDVLLVDDDRTLLGVLARQLVQRGLRVQAAATAREGLRLAAAAPPRVLVLDVGLPDADGFEVVAALRAEEATRALPLLVYTNWDLNAAQRDQLSLGPTRFLVKSRGSAEDFEAAVDEMLVGERARGGRP
jgi:PAS domain S-box-containing protein